MGKEDTTRRRFSSLTSRLLRLDSLVKSLWGLKDQFEAHAWEMEDYLGVIDEELRDLIPPPKSEAPQG